MRLHSNMDMFRNRVQKAGGVFGQLACAIAYYIGLSELLAAEKKPLLRLPLGTRYVNDQ